MATEMKPCEKCMSLRVGINKQWRMAGCDDCGHITRPADWNRRAMPECVRKVADELAASAETYRAIGDDLRADHCDGLLAEVRKYYGVTG